VPDVEQPQQRLEIGLRDGDGLVGRADGVVEADPAVPDRVPDRVGELTQAVDLAVVQQDEVEVGVWRRFAPAEPADRDQREVVVRGEQFAQPAVVDLGELLAQQRTDESGPA
jgi:hypothetical protein